MRRTAAAALLATVAAGVWYLYDPVWLIDQTAGLRAEERASDGALFRWSGGHASFFVPSKAGTILIPVATTFDARGASPIVVTVLVDDVRAGGVVLTDEAWQSITIRLPPPGSRRVRRIDIRTNVVREDNHGVKIGRVQTNP